MEGLFLFAKEFIMNKPTMKMATLTLFFILNCTSFNALAMENHRRGNLWARLTQRIPRRIKVAAKGIISTGSAYLALKQSKSAFRILKNLVTRRTKVLHSLESLVAKGCLIPCFGWIAYKVGKSCFNDLRAWFRQAPTDSSSDSGPMPPSDTPAHMQLDAHQVAPEQDTLTIIRQIAQRQGERSPFEESRIVYDAQGAWQVPNTEEFQDILDGLAQIRQMRCLHQARGENEYTNYCGYYTVFNASCLENNHEADITNHGAFRRAFLPMLQHIQNRGHRAPYDYLDDQEVRALLHQQNIENRVLFLTQAMLNSSQDPHEFMRQEQFALLQNFRAGLSNNVTIVAGWGGANGGHWTTIRVTREHPDQYHFLRFSVYESAGSDWYDDIHIRERIIPLYRLLIGDEAVAVERQLNARPASPAPESRQRITPNLQISSETDSAQTNARDSRQAALHRAILAGNLEQVTELIRDGADTFARNNEGRTPLDEARRIAVPGIRMQIIRALALQGIEGNLECPICLEAKARGTFAVLMPCGHYLCRECRQRMIMTINNARQRQNERAQNRRRLDSYDEILDDDNLARRGQQCPTCRNAIEYVL